MCIYTVKKTKVTKKNSSGGGGLRSSIERPKIRRLRRKEYGKN